MNILILYLILYLKRKYLNQSGEVGFPRLPMPVRPACPTIRICYHSEKAALLGVRLMAGRQQRGHPSTPFLFAKTNSNDMAGNQWAEARPQSPLASQFFLKYLQSAELTILSLLTSADAEDLAQADLMIDQSSELIIPSEFKSPALSVGNRTVVPASNSTLTIFFLK